MRQEIAIRMTKLPFERYKDKLIADIQEAPDFESLEDRLLDAQMEMDSTDEAEEDEDLLVRILQLSHRNVMAGKTFSHEEVERFLDQRFYELGNKVVGSCVAEPL